ncbi:sugar ABC transporter permease [Streptomyces ipomoeae]|jgi:multiple sugar transport system permease protein|nr:sugar ABC transporter permease [Streptomyces ipomoeae]MDX2692395.1 sugar ABC transporter permease [Streptomyces ipomoeae]MDX2819769.1 sugar ABC transporter permease [Streptomyces ipomoeae]MDX2838081.1 sugar ABC transporter permease [Streptomyces ipomoeae]MDX2872395.1 sugar ABC transporter permease [Streptomyces ipomoeae]
MIAALARLRPVRRTRTTSARRRESITALGMATPAVVLLVVFVVVPLALTFALAFTDARLVSPTPARFVGLDNFTRLFDDPVFFKSLRNTVYFTAVVVPFQAGLALVLALLVNAKVRGVNFFRTVYFLPVVTSMVVVSLLWTFLYRQDGLVNHIISALTLGHVDGRDWLGDPATSMPAIILMSVWQGVGFHMIIWLAGLQTIPAELYEAADLDGATRWHRFRHVTWPGLRATRTFVLVTITIQAFGLFTQINVMTKGGPLDSTTTVVYQAVRAGYEQQQTAYAAAISLVFFVLVLTVSLIQRFLTREKD